MVETLAVKKLKDNVKRFGTGISPLFETMSGFRKLFNWHTPLLTGAVFIVSVEFNILFCFYHFPVCLRLSELLLLGAS